jgi:hypothetical protein
MSNACVSKARRPENPCRFTPEAWVLTLFTNLHSAERRLIDMTIEHADLDALIDLMAHALPVDQLMVKRLKKRRLALRDKIAQLEASLRPSEPA